MKKFNFSMNGVRNVRVAQKEAAEMKLMKARAELNEWENAVQVLVDKINSAILYNYSEITFASDFFIQREKYLHKLKKDKRNTEFKVEEAKGKVDMAMGFFKKALIEEKKINIVKNKEHQAWELDFNRSEQVISDEIGTQLQARNRVSE